MPLPLKHCNWTFILLGLFSVLGSEQLRKSGNFLARQIISTSALTLSAGSKPGSASESVRAHHISGDNKLRYLGSSRYSSSLSKITHAKKQVLELRLFMSATDGFVSMYDEILVGKLASTAVCAICIYLQLPRAFPSSSDCSYCATRLL